MIRKVISVIFYVVTGYFLFMISILSFFKTPAVPVFAKFIIIGVCLIPLLVCMFIGLAVSQFQNWKRDIGIVLLTETVFTAFGILTFACLLFTKEFQAMLPPKSFESLKSFSDYPTGFGCMIFFTILAVILLKKPKGV